MTLVQHRLVDAAGRPLRDRTVFAVLVMPFLDRLALPPTLTTHAQARSDIDGRLEWYLRPNSQMQGTSYYQLRLGGNDFEKYTFQVPEQGPINLMNYLVNPDTLTSTAPPATTIVMMKGDQGNPGAQGQTGQTGADSTVPGPRGEPGLPGPAGADSVVPGPRGAAGGVGAAGRDGIDGASSTVPGPRGPAGADSVVPGPEGPRGLPGADSIVPGPAGPRGLAGADSTVAGPRGAEGAIGPTGPPGAGAAGGKTALPTSLGAGQTRDIVVTLNRTMASATGYHPVASIGAAVSILGVVQNQGIVATTANTVTVRIFNSGLTLLNAGAVTVYVVAVD